MKDTRFIELVNLYIDRQLSPAEAAEFEAEIRDNPRRRQLYQQYCRMHRATTLVYESFRAHAGQQGGEPARRPASIARLEGRQRFRARWGYATAGLAAACFAFVLVRNAGFDSPGRQEPAAAVVAATEAPMAAESVLSDARTAAVATQPVVLDRSDLAELREQFLANSDYAALLAGARAREERLIGPAQLVTSRSSLFDDGVFEQRPMLRTIQAAPVQRSRVSSEFTAFQFQR